MKHLKSLLFATALFLGATSFMSAQTKVAHINTQELIKAMPEYKAAQTEVEQAGKTYEAEIAASMKELEAKLKQYDAEAPNQTQAVNTERMQEVEGIKQGIAQYQQDAQQNMSKLEYDKLQPITKKAREAIQKVARAQGFQYVLDASTLIMADGKDLMADVKKELAIQ